MGDLCLRFREFQFHLLAGRCLPAHKARRCGHAVIYFRMSRLFQEVCRISNHYSRFLNKLAKMEVLLLDYFALAPKTEIQSRDLLDIVDDRVGEPSLIIASQLRRIIGTA